MAALATLNPESERLVQDLERDSGAWLLAYAPADAQQAPPFARSLKPARLDDLTLARLQDVEQRTHTVIVAYEPIPSS